MSFARGVPNPIAVVIKDISHSSRRLGLITNSVPTVVIHPIISVVIVLAIVVVIRRVVVVIRTIVVVVLAIVVIERRVFPATYLGKAAARDKEGANKKQSFHFLPTFH